MTGAGSTEWTTYQMGLERSVVAPVFLVFFLWAAVDAVSDTIFGALFFAALAISVFWLLVFRLRLRVSDVSLDARNVFSTKTTALAYIEDIECGYDGMVVRSYDGTRLKVTAIQKPNIALFLNKESRADRIRAEILRRRDEQAPPDGA